MDPSFPGVQYGFNDDLCQPEELYRNSLVSDIKLISPSEFEAIKFTFKTLKPSEDVEALDMNFSKADFSELEGLAASNLLKVAAHSQIQKGL